MIRLLIGVMAIGFGSNSFAAVTCEQLQDENTKLQVIREGKILNQNNWKSFDVVAGFDRNECFGAFDQELLNVNGELLWRFTTHDDSCDGGNTMGVIYTYDLNTPVAHIYDGDLYCEKDWNKEQSAKNHVCDLKAEEFAAKKMKENGFEFTPKSSSVQIRDPYVYSFVYVNGTIDNKNGNEARVRVNVNLKSCEMASAKIDSLKL